MGLLPLVRVVRLASELLPVPLLASLCRLSSEGPAKAEYQHANVSP